MTPPTPERPMRKSPQTFVPVEGRVRVCGIVNRIGVGVGVGCVTGYDFWIVVFGWFEQTSPPPYIAWQGIAA